jgi:hypothetical protein
MAAQENLANTRGRPFATALSVGFFGDRAFKRAGSPCSTGPLIFTEFAGPDGEATYFPPELGTRPTGDELMASVVV